MEYQTEHQKLVTAEAEYVRAEEDQFKEFQEAKHFKIRLMGFAFFLMISWVLWKILTEPDGATKNRIINKIDSIPSATEVIPQVKTPEIKIIEPSTVEKIANQISSNFRSYTEEQLKKQKNRVELKLLLLNLLKDLEVDPVGKNIPSIVESLFMFRDKTDSLQVR